MVYTIKLKQAHPINQSVIIITFTHTPMRIFNHPIVDPNPPIHHKTSISRFGFSSSKSQGHNNKRQQGRPPAEARTKRPRPEICGSRHTPPVLSSPLHKSSTCLKLGLVLVFAVAWRCDVWSSGCGGLGVFNVQLKMKR